VHPINSVNIASQFDNAVVLVIWFVIFRWPVIDMDVDPHRALSRRESQCLEGLARGLDNAAISRELKISMPTVALHLINARKKLGAVTREQAVALAVERGLIRP